MGRIEEEQSCGYFILLIIDARNGQKDFWCTLFIHFCVILFVFYEILDIVIKTFLLRFDINTDFRFLPISLLYKVTSELVLN